MADFFSQLTSNLKNPAASTAPAQTATPLMSTGNGTFTTPPAPQQYSAQGLGLSNTNQAARDSSSPQQIGARNTQTLGGGTNTISSDQTQQGTSLAPVNASTGINPNSFPGQGLQGNTGGQTGQSSAGGGLLGGAFTQQSQGFLQQQTDSLQKLAALRAQIAQAGAPQQAVLGLDNLINQTQNTINNTNPRQFIKDNPNLVNSGITTGQAAREIGQENTSLYQNLANATLAKSQLLQQQQFNVGQLEAQQTGVQAQADIAGQVRQLTMFGGLPPELASAIIQKQLFPQQQITTDAFGQPQAVTFNPTGGVQGTQSIGPNIFGGQGSTTGTPGGNQQGVIGGINLQGGQSGSYATDPQYAQKVGNIYGQLGNATSSPQSLTSYIQQTAPNSPVTGDMILASSTKYGIDPKVLTAVLQNESQFGTQGAGAKTNNPGNVGNTDSGATRNMGSVQQGVDATAAELARRSVGSTQTGNPITNIAQQVLNGQLAPSEAFSQLGTTGQKLLLTNTLNQLSGGTFNQTNAEANFNARKEALSTNATTVRTLQQSQQTAIDHLDALDKVVKDVGFGDTPLFNTARSWWSNNISRDPNITQLQSEIGIVRGEIAKVLGGGTASVESLNEAQTVLPDNLSYNQFSDVKKNIKTLMQSKIDEYSKLGNIPQFGTGQGGQQQPLTNTNAPDPYADKRGQLQSGEILIKRNGQIGAISPNEFDPKTDTKL